MSFWSDLWHSFVLKDQTSTEKGYVSAVEKPELIGCKGIVSRELRPAGTVIINGEPGTYNLYTTRDEVAKDADNVLEGTVDAPLKVAENNVYALADKGANGIGFFRCQEGVEIPKHKAYYHSKDASVDAFIFEGTTGIREAVAGNDASDAYTISGMKVKNTSKKGVYIVNGKKVVVK